MKYSFQEILPTSALPAKNLAKKKRRPESLRCISLSASYTERVNHFAHSESIAEKRGRRERKYFERKNLIINRYSVNF
jgi:hypothetical protein